MGDRGNIVLWFRRYGTEDVTPIFFYSHWGGSMLPETLVKALDSDAGRNRWQDDSYLARIIFDQLTFGDQGSETGFGISPWETDNEHPLVNVNLDDMTVNFEGSKTFYSYEEFISLVKSDQQLEGWK